MEDTLIQVLQKHEQGNQQLIRMLVERTAERGTLLQEVLDEVNDAYANGGHSRLSEALVKRIEEVLEK